MKFTIAGINFKTKELAKQYYKTMLNAFSAIGKDKEDWLETLNMFCSNSMENIAGLFRS
jgi:hypothetical protein